MVYRSQSEYYFVMRMILFEFETATKMDNKRFLKTITSIQVTHKYTWKKFKLKVFLIIVEIILNINRLNKYYIMAYIHVYINNIL